MNVYINKHILNNSVSIMVLVAANSPEEAWNTIINNKQGEYYFTVYDDFGFSLIEGLTYNGTEPKIIQETGYIVK